MLRRQLVHLLLQSGRIVADDGLPDGFCAGKLCFADGELRCLPVCGLRGAVHRGLGAAHLLLHGREGLLQRIAVRRSHRLIVVIVNGTQRRLIVNVVGAVMVLLPEGDPGIGDCGVVLMHQGLKLVPLNFVVPKLRPLLGAPLSVEGGLVRCDGDIGTDGRQRLRTAGQQQKCCCRHRRDAPLHASYISDINHSSLPLSSTIPRGTAFPRRDGADTPQPRPFLPYSRQPECPSGGSASSGS